MFLRDFPVQDLAADLNGSLFFFLADDADLVFVLESAKNTFDLNHVHLLEIFVVKDNGILSSHDQEISSVHILNLSYSFRNCKLGDLVLAVNGPDSVLIAANEPL